MMDWLVASVDDSSPRVELGNDLLYIMLLVHLVRTL